MPKDSILNRTAIKLETAFRLLSRPWRDGLVNFRLADSQSPFLVHRCTLHKATYFSETLDWIEQHASDLREQFWLYATPNSPPNLKEKKLLINSFNETTLQDHPALLSRIQQLESECDQQGIRTINRTEGLLRMRKSECGDWLAKAGVRAPKAVSIVNREQFQHDIGDLEFPLLIREELIHGGHAPSYLVQNYRELGTVPLHQMAQPFASEYIDTRGDDGNYRKYRYVAIGEIGIPFTQQVSPTWEARTKSRITNKQTTAEELEFMKQPDPNHDLFQHAMKIIGLDYAAFDYSYTSEGQPVVWELNVTPGWGKYNSKRSYVQIAQDKIFAATLAFYFSSAGLDVPDALSVWKERKIA
jgi:hypothetical protein